MNCPEVRKLLHLYRDSELESKATLEIEQHLEACPECAELFTAEERFDERMTEALRQGPRTGALWAQVEARIKPRRRFTELRRFWRLAIATAVVLVVLAVSLVWQAARPLELATAAGECHNAYVLKITSAEFTGAVPPAIAGQLGGRLDTVAFDYRPASAQFTTAGARLCHFSDVPVALILGQYESVPVSLVVFKQSELARFPQAKRRLESGDPIVCSRTGRYQFAARLVGDHVVCVIGEAPRPQLEELLKTVAKSS